MIDHTILKSQRGFTLTEILVTLVLVGIFSSAMLSLYITNTRDYTVQTQVVDVQQNLRAAISMMAKDLRMAGFDPSHKANAGVLTAGTDAIAVTMDLNEDWDVADSGESISYSLSGGNLIRTAGAADTVANNVVACGFAYAFDANEDGQLDTDAGGRVHWAIPGAGGNWFELDANNDDQITPADDTDGDGTINAVDTGIPVKQADIRAVRIWILAQSDSQEQGFTNPRSFVVSDKVLSPGDGFHCRDVTTIVKLRNMGL